MLEPNTRTAEPQRRQWLSAWLLGVILLIVGLSIYGAAVGDSSIRHGSAKKIQASDTDLDDEAVQDLITVDLYTKAAFITSVIDGKPDRKYLKEALPSAVSLVDETHNAPFAARRLIVVRALYGLPPLVKTKKGSVPLDAYTVNLPSSYSSADRKDYIVEARLWGEAFAPDKLTTAQAQYIAGQLRHQPNLKWWREPALFAIYSRAGDTKDAGRAASDAVDKCMTSVSIGLILMVFKFVTVLLGILLLVILGMAAYARHRARVDAAPTGLDQTTGGPMPGAWNAPLNAYGQPGTPAIAGMPRQSSSELWKVVPDAIAESDRRLTAADLFGIFLLYMVLAGGLGVVVSGFSGVGHGHLFKFAGLLAPYQHDIKHMGASARMILLVGIEAALYIVGGGVPILCLIVLARRRGASLGRELGMTRKITLQSVLYGFGGYCIGMPLMVLVGLVAPEVFRHFPTPSNPAIPQLISANSAAAAILIVLASFIAPVVEETLFRGVLYNAIKMRVGVWPAILLSGFIFGFIHPVGVAEMFPLAVLGGVFAWMAETRKSLAPSMVAHCINNLSTCILVFSLMQQ